VAGAGRVVTERLAGRARRRGAALVAVVLLALALFAVAHGMLVMSLGELAASRAGARLVEARAAADGAVHAVLGDPGSASLDSVLVGGSVDVGAWALGRAIGATTLRRLAPEVWWVEGVGRLGAAQDRVARLAWALDPLERVRFLRGAATVGPAAPVAIAGIVDSSTPAAAVPPLTVEDCAPWSAELATLYASAPLQPVAAFEGADTLPRLGRLDFVDLLTAAPIEVVGAGAPAPVDPGGVCVTSAPWNWGDPERRWRPCGDHLPLRRSPTSLRVGAGVGQVVLVVDGDVTLEAGARVYGLVLASGMLHLEDGAELVGMALAAGGLAVAPAARLRASACWAARALASQRATLGGLHPLPGSGPIGPLG